MAHAGHRQRIHEEISAARGHGSRILPRSRGSNDIDTAVTLEELGLAVDPAARRLVPATGYLMSLAI